MQILLYLGIIFSFILSLCVFIILWDAYRQYKEEWKRFDDEKNHKTNQKQGPLTYFSTS